MHSLSVATAASRGNLGEFEVPSCKPEGGGGYTVFMRWISGQIRWRFPARRGVHEPAAVAQGEGRHCIMRALRPIALLAGAWAGLPVHGQCQYEVAAVLHIPLNCSIGPVYTTGRAMNRHGTVVGSYSCPLWEHDEAFVWTADEGFTTLQRPPWVVSAIAEDINDDGVICGTMIVNGFGDRGFVYDGVWTELPAVIPESGFSKALAISNSGVVVGQRQIGTYKASPYNGYIWSSLAGFLDLGIMSGSSSAAYDITESGIVLGWTGEGWLSGQGFLWKDGAATFLGLVPGGSTSDPLALSEEGVVVGGGLVPSPSPAYPYGVNAAFIWKSGSFTMLGTLPGYEISQAKGVNALGQVVGRSYGVNGNANIRRAFIWQNDLMTDLNDLVPPGLGTISNASLVADDGTIMAYRGSDTLILKPVNVPIGDLDLDCRVGILDFLNLLEHWGPCPVASDCCADFDGDGVVGFTDFAMLLGSWG